MKSTDLGVYVTGSGSFDAAEMDADKYEIAGRNGDLIIPKNRYKNIVVTYPAFIPKAFQEKAQSIRNWMRSAKAYARLEDTYDMEHYRLGLASGIQSFEPVNRNDASNFQLNFDCRPERFLKTGETPLTIEPEAHSYSGEIVSFETVAVDDMTKAEVSLSPKQDGTPSIESGVNNAPYLFRPTGATAECNYETNKVVGGTIAWNQLARELDGTYWQGTNTTASFSNGVVSFTASARYGCVLTKVAYKVPAVNGHKYFLSGKIKPASTSNVRFGMGVISKFGNEGVTKTAITGDGSTFQNIDIIGNFTGDNTANNCVIIMESATGDFAEIQAKDIVLFDLTQMFGTTIADYIYSLEQSTAGAGVAWFRKLFPKPYYTYNAGELMSVQTSAHKMVGFNAWDEVTESGYINPSTGQPASATGYSRSKNFSPCVPSMNYYFACSASQDTTVVLFYDANENYISYLDGSDVKNRVFTTPANAAFFKIYFKDSGYNHDICINLSWDGERNGEYEEYKQWVYPLDSDLVLRGIPKLDSGNYLYYDGDEYESDGTVTRKYGTVTFDGSNDEYWSARQNVDNEFYVSGKTADAFVVGSSTQTTVIGIVSNRLASGTWADYNVSKRADISLFYGQPWIIIRVAGVTDVASLRTLLAANPLVVTYLLATPTTESADPFTNPQVADKWGTEEYMDSRTVPIPVGHVTQYGMQYAITGRTGTSLKIGAEYPTADREYTSSFGQTVYGGTFDFVSGELEVQWANIASYNGETITEPWLSSMDVYSAGATPTTGAQVVYKLATPIEIDLDPTEAQTLFGLNNVWASDGTVEINYSDPFNVDNPTYFEARPLFEITNPAQNDVLNVNGKTITFLSSYTGTVTIDCETMDCFSGYTNLNYLISATDFLVLNEGVNIVTWSGSDTCKMAPRWWEL